MQTEVKECKLKFKGRSKRVAHNEPFFGTILVSYRENTVIINTVMI